MIAAILRLRPVDQILVWAFIAYSVFVIAGWIYLERERILVGKKRTLNGLILHLEQLTNWLRSDREEYDPGWMDPEELEEGYDG